MASTNEERSHLNLFRSLTAGPSIDLKRSATSFDSEGSKIQNRSIIESEIVLNE